MKTDHGQMKRFAQAGTTPVLRHGFGYRWSKEAETADLPRFQPVDYAVDYACNLPALDAVWLSGLGDESKRAKYGNQQ
jgi:hypothetical protein